MKKGGSNFTNIIHLLRILGYLKKSYWFLIQVFFHYIGSSNLITSAEKYVTSVEDGDCKYEDFELVEDDDGWRIGYTIQLYRRIHTNRIYTSS